MKTILSEIDRLVVELPVDWLGRDDSDVNEKIVKAQELQWDKDWDETFTRLTTIIERYQWRPYTTHPSRGGYYNCTRGGCHLPFYALYDKDDNEWRCDGEVVHPLWWMELPLPPDTI